jgi:hypothetical protein
MSEIARVFDNSKSQFPCSDMGNTRTAIEVEPPCCSGRKGTPSWIHRRILAFGFVAKAFSIFSSCAYQSATNPDVKNGVFKTR